MTAAASGNIRPTTLNVFVTVGTQLPFDRLIIAVDEWAGRNPHARVVAQTCSTADGYKPKHFERVIDMLDADDCAKLMQRADVTIAHAGMGTILTALDLDKRLIVMPRRAALGEHRNDHQWATTQRLRVAGLVEVAADAEELCSMLASAPAAKADCAAVGVAADQAAIRLGLPIRALNGNGSTKALVDTLVQFVRHSGPRHARRRLRAATISSEPLVNANASANASTSTPEPA